MGPLLPLFSSRSFENFKFHCEAEIELVLRGGAEGQITASRLLTTVLPGPSFSAEPALSVSEFLQFHCAIPLLWRRRLAKFRDAVEINFGGAIFGKDLE